MSLKPITVLRRARKLIADRQRWIKGSFTGKRKGVQCYCALGAIAAVAGVKFKSGMMLSDGAKPEEYDQAHQLLRNAIGCGVPSFNDDKKTRHATVLAVFDKAIALAKAAKTVTVPAG